MSRFIIGNLLKFLPATTRVGLVGFSDRVLGTIGFDQSRQKIWSSVTGVSKAEGLTAVLDTVFNTTDMFAPAQAGDALVLLTDGGDTRSKASSRRVQERLWSKGIRVFTFEFADERFQTEEEKFGREEIRDLSLSTGGEIADIEQPDTTKIFDAVRQLSERISHYYVAQLSVVATPLKPVQLELEAFDSSGGHNKHPRLFSQRKIMPCPQPDTGLPLPSVR